MDLYFYAFTKKLNSTKRPTISTATLSHTVENVRLKEPTSLYNPTFILNRFDDIEEYNIVVMDSYYYYINDLVYMTNNIVEISCTLDPMATYKNVIGTSNQLIIRSTDENMIADGSELFDPEYPVYAATTARYVEIANVFDYGFYVIGLIATGLNSIITRRGAVSYIAMKQSEVLSFLEELQAVTGATADLNPLQYVVSCVYIPVAATWARNPQVDQINLGSIGEYNYEITYTPIIFPVPSTIHNNTWEAVQQEIFLEKHPQYDGNNEYFNYSPFYSATLFAGPFGNIDIPTDLWSAFISRDGRQGIRRFFITILIDLPTGDGKLLLQMPDATTPILPADKAFYEVSAKLGVPIELAQITRMSGSDIASLVTGMGSIAGNMLSGNPIGAVASMANVAVNTYLADIPKLSTAGASGSFIGLTEQLYIIEKIKRQVPYNNTIGKLVCANYDINDALPGSFIKTENAHLDIIAPSHIIREIEQIMNDGFYWE